MSLLLIVASNSVLDFNSNDDNGTKELVNKVITSEYEYHSDLYSCKDIECQVPEGNSTGGGN